MPRALHDLKRSTSRERDTSFPLATLNVGLAARSDGHLVAYHWEFDHDRNAAGRDDQGGPGMTNIRVFASLIAPTLDSACIDLPLPVLTDIPPFPVTVADTTYVFSRSVNMENGTVTSLLSAFHLDASACSWEPLTRVTSPR
jgi:hypothetical protein